MSERHIRSIAKAFSWRVIGTTDTTLLSWLVTLDFKQGIKIGGLEFLTKTVLFYLHERLWLRVRWAQAQPGPGAKPQGPRDDHHRRSLAKGVSWRLTAFVDTVIIATFITHHYGVALTIGAMEVSTKIFLYYLHERVWQKIDIGRRGGAGLAASSDGEKI